MQIILDENLPKHLKRVLTRYQVTTVPQQGWSGISNGQLIKRIDGTTGTATESVR